MLEGWPSLSGFVTANSTQVRETCTGLSTVFGGTSRLEFILERPLYAMIRGPRNGTRIYPSETQITGVECFGGSNSNRRAEYMTAKVKRTIGAEALTSIRFWELEQHTGPSNLGPKMSQTNEAKEQFDREIPLLYSSLSKF